MCIALPCSPDSKSYMASCHLFVLLVAVLISSWTTGMTTVQFLLISSHWSFLPSIKGDNSSPKTTSVRSILPIDHHTAASWVVDLVILAGVPWDWNIISRVPLCWKGWVSWTRIYMRFKYDHLCYWCLNFGDNASGTVFNTTPQFSLYSFGSYPSISLS